MYEPEEDAFESCGAPRTCREASFASEQKSTGSKHLTGLLWKHQKAVIRKDIEAQAQFAIENSPFLKDFISYCAVPLVVRGNSVGVVTSSAIARNNIPN